MRTDTLEALRAGRPPLFVGAATTQDTTALVWLPSDAERFANETQKVWTQLDAAMLTCATTPASSGSSTPSLGADRQAAFMADFTEWETFFSGGGPYSFWWNTDTISASQAKAAAWYNEIQKACPAGTNLPKLPKPTPGADLATATQVGAGLLVVGVVGVGVWFAWPWLSSFRTTKTKAPRKAPNPRKKKKR